ncbi:hypothetical protein [Limosilactobacillus caccae]|uniref:hypothetical protein n=1 Tax=Limosilactobacillus caccae TaxID=1926284 RepID=UPI000970D31D|nr:hypothetical protein [Limosilactobacillus caccae]
MAELNYVELTGEAKETALRSFINFYVHQFANNSLEILGSHASNGVMATINEILQQYNFMGHRELVELSYKLSKPAYEEILEELTDVKYSEDGEPVIDWEQAWEEKEEKLPEED